MKKSFATAVATLACVTGFGQGTVSFANAGVVNAPITNDFGVRLGGAGYRAGLFAGPDQTQLTLIATAPFLTGAAAGYFNGGVVVIPNVSAGGIAWVRVVAWDTAYGETYFAAQANGVWGSGSVFSVVTGNPSGSPPSPHATLLGMSSFTVGHLENFHGFAIQPTNQTVLAGGTATFYTRVDDAFTQYQWRFNGTDIPGAGGSTCLIPEVQLTNAGSYYVVATNQFWGVRVSASATLTVLHVIQPVPQRTVPALTLMGQPGNTLNLDATDTLVPAPNWVAFDSAMLTNASQWYFDLSAPLPTQRFYRAWQINTPVAPALDAYMVPALTLTGSVGSTLRVDGRNQFGPTGDWFTLDTVTLTNTSQLYFDTSAISQPPRLYRLVQVP